MLSRRHSECSANIRLWNNLDAQRLRIASRIGEGSTTRLVYECKYRRVAVERDMDLVRDVLLKLAADPELDGSPF